MVSERDNANADMVYPLSKFAVNIFTGASSAKHVCCGESFNVLTSRLATRGLTYQS